MKNSTHHICFDLETLGHTPTAPIVQIGAVKFDLEFGIMDTFISTINLKTIDFSKFNIDGETVQWWFSQSKEAIQNVMLSGDVSLSKALYDFRTWIGELSNYYYWSHSIFDPPILFNNILSIGQTPFIPYRLYKDINTLKLLYKYTRGDVYTSFEFDGIQHTALDDAKNQALDIKRMLNELGYEKL